MTPAPTALDALALRAEAATGADRELDAAIGIEVFDGGADHLDDARYVTRARRVVITHSSRLGDFAVVGISGMQLRSAPAYTASLDAAIALVPEGFFLTLDRYIVSDEPGQRGSWRVWLKFIHPTDQIEKHFARCDTPALAICAAALRARARARTQETTDVE